MKDRYIIMITTLTGSLEGKVSFQDKNGYLVGLKSVLGANQTYSSKGFATRACNKMQARNDTEYSLTHRPGRDRYFDYYVTDKLRFEPVVVSSSTGKIDSSQFTEDQLTAIECWD